MHLCKEYARSATTNTDNMRNILIYERALEKDSFLNHYSHLIQIVWHKHHVCSERLRKRKNEQFCVQEFSEEIEFHELTQQGSNLDEL